MLSYDAGIISPERSIEIDHQAFDIGEEMLMIYSRDRPTLSLGRFSTMDSIDQECVERNGISIVRRISGGNPIYCDQGQITVTYVSPREDLPEKEGSYEFFGMRMVDALSHLGIEAEYKPMNDILLNGMKISGSAQYRNDTTVLIHGSLILMKGRYFDCIRQQKHHVTSIKEECGHVPKRMELFDALKTSFQD